jgi:hypothetical protein
MTAQREVCTLTDNLRPVPFRQGGEETLIFSPEQLVTTLRSFAIQEPRVLIISKPGGPQLFLGLAGKLASVRTYPDPAKGRAWSAKPKTSFSAEDVWITSEGEPSWFEASAMMPVADAIQIVAYIVEHNELPNTVYWENLRGERIRSLREGIIASSVPRNMPSPKG